MLIPPYPPSVNFVEGPNDPETSGDVLATPPRRLKPLGFSLRMALWWSLVDGGLGMENHGIYGLNWGFPKSWGYPNSWMVYYGHPNLKWMMIGATPNFFRNPPICLHQRCTGWQCAKDSHHACHLWVAQTGGRFSGMTLQVHPGKRWTYHSFCSGITSLFIPENWR